ncbi:MAG: ATP-binding protein, partial [Clostridiales bacterium]|nr:ATP-binding protein [Clostridiales bacterium]
MRFINRYNELDFLKREYNKNEASLIILYGRRRIGKTALATEFIKDKEALYYLATEESE